MGEPGAYSAVIVIEKDWPDRWQEDSPTRDLMVLVDCKSFRTEEGSSRAADPNG